VTSIWIPALFALFLWWFGTGIVLLIGRAPRAMALGLGTLALGGALGAVALSATQADFTGACVAFTAAIMIWGWHELSFLTGALTGPRRAPCPPGARGWLRFRMAAATLIHHEIALAATAAGLGLWLWDAANPVALWTFLALWILRLSVKFNIYLGAPNVAVEFLPDDLRYLASYFSRKPMNLLFPVSVTAGTVIAGGMLLHAATVAATPFDVAALTLVGMLIALGTLEHWFLVLSVSEASLWRWYIDTRARKRANRAHRAPDLSPLSAPTLLRR